MNSNDTRPLGYWITAVDRLMRAEFATVFEDEGITRRDWRMLNRIAGTHGERPTHDRHGHRLRRLIGLGWIERTADDWALTESGTLAMQRLSSSVEEIRARVADVLTAEEYAAMTASLEKVARGFGWEDGKPLPRRHGRAGRGRGGERRSFGHGHEGHGHSGHGHSGHGDSGHGHSGHGRFGHRDSGHGHEGHGHSGHGDSGHRRGRDQRHGHANGRFGRERGFGHAHGHEGENSQGHPHHRGHSGHGHSGHGDSGHEHSGHGRHGFGPRHMSEGRFSRVQHVHFHTHC
ncbi:hypothetical protein FVO59_04950 [Microbacterium esteraromaticum]|uniref:Uncharacterized protein n=1 Tax=Microbacterium esteraromaticum TaxID=57043 RepID=A0A7D7WGC9_9MICO|nr:hypothetical protein [Microbacterium esteraromaticum]QMU96633.1 hypothetical protein FVO59_04950 [Microbacterium esteraromaticum]